MVRGVASLTEMQTIDLVSWANLVVALRLQDLVNMKAQHDAAKKSKKK